MKKIFIFTFAVASLCLFTACETQLMEQKTADLGGNDIRKVGTTDPGEYNADFDMFSLALSLSLRDFSCFKDIFVWKLQAAGTNRQILVRDLITGENGAELANILNSSVGGIPVEELAVKYPNIRITLTDEFEQMPAMVARRTLPDDSSAPANPGEGIAVVYKSYEYEEGADLYGYINGDEVYQTDNIEDNENFLIIVDEMSFDYNADFDKVAFTVSQLLRENDNFRQIVYEEVGKMFDGDYNVLISQLIVNYPETEEWFNSEEFEIKSIVEKYPLIQIAVPMNFEKWKGEALSTVYLPYDYQENVTEFVYGYNKDGEIVSFRENVEPDFPVAVINENERVKSITAKTVEESIPPTPTALTAQVSEFGIYLNWSMPAGTDGTNTSGYKIYRKTAAESDYILLSVANGHSNREYQDRAVTHNVTYRYYVVAFNAFQNSAESNYITFLAPRPNIASSFLVQQETLNSVKLTWAFAANEYNGRVKIYKRNMANGSNDYSDPIVSLQMPVDEYFDTNVIPGQKIEYKLERETGVGTSIPKYDFIYTPYRNMAENSKVYIQRIKYSDVSKIESGWKGAPEFQVKILGTSGTTTTEIHGVYISMNTREDNKWTALTDCNVVANWKPGGVHWYDCISFYLVEDDAEKTWFNVFESLSLVAQKVEKILPTTAPAWIKGVLQGVDVTATVVTKWCVDEDEKIGYVHLNYYDPINIEVSSPRAQDTDGYVTLQFANTP